MAKHPEKRLVVEARHRATWVTVTVLPPDRAERAASVAADVLGNPAFDVVRVCLEVPGPGGRMVRRPVFQRSRAMMPFRAAEPSVARSRQGGWSMGRLAASALALLAAGAILAGGEPATASLSRTPEARPGARVVVLDLPAPVAAAPAPIIEAAAPVSLDPIPEPIPPRKAEPAAKPSPAKPAPVAARPPEPVVQAPPVVAERTPAPPPVPMAEGEPPKPTPVASWLEADADPFDPGKVAFRATPLPPEAVPAPPPIPEPARSTTPPEEKAAEAFPAPASTQPPLEGVTLVLGQSMGLGRPLAATETRCRQKKSWTGVYCIEAMDWPESAQALFAPRTLLHPGMTGVARYDEGMVSRYHVQFRNQDFEAVVAWFQSRLGPPTEIPAPRMAWLGATRKPNTAYRWASGDGTALEVRRFDDASGTFPDRFHGVIELGRPDSGPVFGELSSLDLVRLSMAAASSAPADGQP